MESNQPMTSGVCYEFPTTTLLRLTGSDRQTWLHSFCTADINGLEPGKGCEAFVLNVKGKTIAHMIVLMSKFDLTVIVIGDPEIKITDHFHKYIISEDVQIEDIGKNHRLWYLSGEKLNLMFDKSLKDAPRFSHALVRDRSVAIATEISGRRDWMLLVTVTEDLTQWYGGVTKIDDDQFDQLRFKSRWPETGKDVTLARLPQEFCRDETAISFEKGCYLGQETVARVDAIGHVNYFFVGLQCDADFDSGEIDLLRDEKSVGSVTSSNGKHGLGFVRRMLANRGEKFESQAGQVTIV